MIQKKMLFNAHISMFIVVVLMASTFNSLALFQPKAANAALLNSLVCGETITVAGTYYLYGNLDCTGTGRIGITIAANDVTIDGRGFTIDGDIKDVFAGDEEDFTKAAIAPVFNSFDPSTWQWGIISLDNSGLTIKNLHVANFWGGIAVAGVLGSISDITIQNSTITNNVPYNMSYIFPFGIYLNNTDSSTITQNEISGMADGIVLTAVTNSTISANTVTGAWLKGVLIDGGSTGLTVENNIIKGSFAYGLQIADGTDNTITGNTIVFNRIDADVSDPSNIFTGNTFAHNIDSIMITATDITRTIAQGATVDFAFYMQDSSGNNCPTCTYTIVTDPDETIYDVNQVDNNVTGSFDATREGTYSLQISVTDGSNTAYRNQMFYVNPVGSETNTYYFRAKENTYPMAGFDAVHGQPKGRDGGSFTLTPPTETETEQCSKFVENSVDEIPNYPMGLITEENLDFWHKEMDAMDGGIQRFGFEGATQNDYTSAIAQSAGYAFSSGEAVFSGITNWAMDYPFSWYLLTFEYGAMGYADIYPYIQTRPEAPSTDNITHIYPTTPAVKSLSNPDVLLLAANPSDTTPALSTITLDGSYSSVHSDNVTLDNYNYPFETGTTRINSDGSATLMANNVTGKTTFDSVNMAITPDSGYVDTSITTWNVGAGGNYYKKWSEAGSLSDINTAHSIADMAVNAFYNILVDGRRYITVNSDVNGVITFNYAGGYSSHVFEVTGTDTGSFSAPGSYSIVLGQQPTGDVTVAITTDGATSVSLDTLTFTNLNWDMPQTVAVALFTPRPCGGTSLLTHTLSSSDVVYDNTTFDLNASYSYSCGGVSLPPSPSVSVPAAAAPPAATSPTAETAGLVLSDPAPAAALPQGVTIGTLVRRADISSVYFIDQDNRRHAFPNEKVYLSYYPDFSGIDIISAATMASIPLGQNVTMRPGTYLVKIQSDPKVYAVEPYGVLRWVSTEQIAISLYGSNWDNRIADVDPTFFTNYQVGSAITDITHLTGSVFSYQGDSKVYYVDNGQKRYISASVFSSNKFQDKFIVRNVNPAISYPSGTDLASQGMEAIMTLR